MPAPTLLERLNSKTVTREDIVRGLAFTRRSATLQEAILDVIARVLGERTDVLIKPACPPTLSPERPEKPENDALRDLARPGIGSVRIRPHDRHRWMVSIDDAAPFAVAGSEAALLEELIRQDGSDDDGFAPFRKIADIAAARGCKPGSVRMAILRLRRRLHSAGRVSPWLVETRRHEVRLRLRRPRQQTGHAVTLGESVGAPLDEG